MTASVPLRGSRGVASRGSRSKNYKLPRSFVVRQEEWRTPQDDSTMAFLRNPLRSSSPAAKELAQNPCAFFGQHAGNNLNLMIHFGVVEDGEG